MKYFVSTSVSVPSEETAKLRRSLVAVDVVKSRDEDGYRVDMWTVIDGSDHLVVTIVGKRLLPFFLTYKWAILCVEHVLSTRRQANVKLRIRNWGSYRHDHGFNNASRIAKLERARNQGVNGLS